MINERQPSLTVLSLSKLISPYMRVRNYYAQSLLWLVSSEMSAQTDAYLLDVGEPPLIKKVSREPRPGRSAFRPCTATLLIVATTSSIDFIAVPWHNLLRTTLVLDIHMVA